MRDKDIRPLLTSQFLHKYTLDGQSKIVEEMGVCVDDSRIDMAVINGHLHGYEIKSNQDSLTRLQSQLHDYSKVFDYLTFVVGNKHTMNVKKSIPSWCGIIEVKYVGESLELQLIQKPLKNKDTDALSIAQLLWKEECISLLKSKGFKALSGKSRLYLWDMVALNIPKKELTVEVRLMLKARQHWKVAEPTFPCAYY